MAKQLREFQLPTNKLQKGMHVTRLDRPWLESKFLLQGFVIQSDQELADLREHHDYVYVEVTESFQQKYGRLLTHTPEKQKPVDDWKKKVGRVHYQSEVPFEVEFENAKEQFLRARAYADELLTNLRDGGSFDLSEARRVVEGCVASLLRNHEALVWLTQIKNKDEYTAEHSMNVCVLSANFGRHLGLVEKDLIDVGLCGLLHDVGKTKISLEILNKPGPLDADEMKEMRLHPTYGQELLLEASKKYNHYVEAAYNHHERENGSGYPNKKLGHQVSFFSKIVALADTYDAITSHRCYDASRSSMTALKILHECKGSHYDAELVTEFIKCIGVYPPGCIVELRNGMVAIVIRSDVKTRLRPRLMLVTDGEKRALQIPKIVDISKTVEESPEQDPYTIMRQLTNGSYGVDLKDYLGHKLHVQADDDALNHD